MDLVGPFSDYKKAHFAFLKPFTRTSQEEHYMLVKCNSKMVLFRMHKSIVGLAIIKLATPQACKQCRVASHTAQVATLKCRQNADNLAKMQFTNCFTCPPHSWAVPQNLRWTSWRNNHSMPHTSTRTDAHIHVHTCIHILVQKQVKLLTLITQIERNLLLHSMFPRRLLHFLFMSLPLRCSAD